MAVEYGIPIPNGHAALQEMRELAKAEVGGSLIVHCTPNNIGGYAKLAAGKSGWWTSRKQPDGTYRVWKTKEL